MEPLSPKEIERLIQKVLEANRDTLMRCGPRGQYQIKATIDGGVYVLGLNNGRAGQFYPPNKPDKVALRPCQRILT
ncbi:hypothetical protein ACFFV7_35880 [Nonomuraea spiralis]|uniref:Uncharacterized protein n=1 Tax=Nonomuraea spiralis TaxID=46182 RepID=A0ABV5IQ30_9ACTN|nr:hypothetical protein [Nonomuraea spiralis]GGT11299.1 hypothetical protein GCM10010176_064880 [Nonomuraea spiralis]